MKIDCCLIFCIYIYPYTSGIIDLKYREWFLAALGSFLAVKPIHFNAIMEILLGIVSS
jgi:hypothetical protein